MTILVTGGAGFIGSNFVLDWMDTTDEILINLDKLTYAGNLENLHSIADNPRHIFVRGDIGDADLVARLLDTHRPRWIINFAAETHVDRSILNSSDFITTNIVATHSLLESVRRYWEGLEGDDKTNFRFLHISTDEVYGSLQENEPPFVETSNYQPNSPYSASKAASDHLVRAYYHTYGLPVLTTNCSNNYGPFQFTEKLIPLVIQRALAGEKLPIYGDGKNIRDWLFVTDHCNAIHQVLKNGKCGEKYNIGGSSEKTNLDVVHMICNILDRKNPRGDGKSYAEQISFVKDRPGHDRRYAINSSKIKMDCGWMPKERFEAGLEKTVAWYLDNFDR